MQIDWLTVSAQIVNFLILVWLLRRFLYGPIIGAMERRQQRIKDRLREAEHARSEAEDQARAYHGKQEEWEQQRERMLAEARELVAQQRQSLEREARAEIEVIKRAWQQQLEAEREAFLRQLRRRATEQFIALAQRALGDLAGADLQQQIALGFIKQLAMLDRHAVARLLQACTASGGVVKLRSRFELSASSKRQLTQAIHQRLDKTVRIVYETADDAPCGIELEVGSEAVAWSIEGYLDGFEQAVDEQLSSVLIAAEEQSGP